MGDKNSGTVPEVPRMVSNYADSPNKSGTCNENYDSVAHYVLRTSKCPPSCIDAQHR